MNDVVNVGIAGYGTIGKRTADGILKQPDMKLVGVAKTKPDYAAYIALKKGIDVYATPPENEGRFKEEGFPIVGTIEDLLEKIDIVVDTAPGKIGVNNKPMYEKARVKMIFQGGEKADVAEVSFCAQVNYDKAFGKDSVRVVSCNTTGLSRVLHAIDQEYGIKQAKVVLVRRAADPKEDKGPINAIEPVLKVPSHHGPDLNTVLPHIKIATMAVKVPTTLMHLHNVMVELDKEAKREEVVKIFENTRRVVLVSGAHGVTATHRITEITRDLGRSRYDLPEVAMWEDPISVVDGWLYSVLGVHQESIVLPENIDAIRAMMEMASKQESIKLTDKTLGILQGRLY
ncbi:MAG: type II glyceraldehyde-3-phosphate dehydrogenase [Candidatus Hodarchaeota archaeon]